MDRTDIKAYKRGSRLPEHVAAYNAYMREYMWNYRRGYYGKNRTSYISSPHKTRKRKEV